MTADGSGTSPPSIPALAGAFDLDPAGAEVVRSASRHIVRFPAAGVRAVVVPGEGGASEAEAATARELAAAEVPAARVSAGPAPVGGWTVTVWAEIPAGTPAEVADPATLGRLAAELHRATGPLGRARFSPCSLVEGARAQQRLALETGASRPDELDLLREETDRAAALLRDAESAAADGDPDAGRSAVVHGDLHEDNVVMGRDGPVLVDLELAGWGLRACDAAPTVAFVRWYGRARSDLAAFDTAYGAPLTEECASLRLDEVWRAWSVSWAVANRHRSDAAEDEALVRLQTLRRGIAPRPWVLR